MSSSTLVLAGVIASVVWILVFLETGRIFRNPKSPDFVRVELVQMLTSVVLVCLLCINVAMMTLGLNGILGVSVLWSWLLASALFAVLLAVVSTLLRRFYAGGPSSDARAT